MSNGRSLSIPQTDVRIKILGVLIFAAATIIGAKMSIPLWFTPVPITFQVLVVVLSGLVLGSRLGAMSQIAYVSIGLAGAPVFTFPVAGPAALLGPTGGYLIGFIAGAFIAGWIYERFRSKTALAAFPGAISGAAMILLSGGLWLGLWLSITGARPWSGYIANAWTMGIQPFILIDLVKAALAAALAAGGRSGVRILGK